jgi:hypothetical protein
MSNAVRSIRLAWAREASALEKASEQTLRRIKSGITIALHSHELTGSGEIIESLAGRQEHRATLLSAELAMRELD